MIKKQRLWQSLLTSSISREQAIHLMRILSAGSACKE